MHFRRVSLLVLLSGSAVFVAVACGDSNESAPQADSDAAADGSLPDGTTASDGSSSSDVAVDVTSDTTSDVASDVASDVTDGGVADVATDAVVLVDGGAYAHQIGAGDQHTCVIRGGGTVRCWGGNKYGQLGNGNDGGASTSTPVDVVGLTDAVELTAGPSYTCARRAGGGVACWGEGRYFGTPDAGGSSVPVNVPGITDAVQISARSYHVCALRANHHVVCWGSNQGRIGDGTAPDRPTPTEPVSPDGGVMADGVSVATGWGHTCIVHQNGHVTCSGTYNAWSQVGSCDNAEYLTPIEVSGLTNAVQVGLGYYTSCARLADDTVKCWGNNQAGQLGLGTSDSNLHGTPVAVPGMTNVAMVAPSGFGTCVLTKTGQVHCWGNDVAGSGTGNSTSPQLVTTSGTVVEVAGGDAHACARLTTGAIQCWGSNYAGQIGAAVDAGAKSVSPVDVPGL